MLKSAGRSIVAPPSTAPASPSHVQTPTSRICPDIGLEGRGYEPLRQLATTAHATVVLVRGKAKDRCYVVKTFALAGLDSKHRKGVLQEINLLKNLQHPYVISYVDQWFNGFSASSSRMTVVMEHADNGDLHSPKNAMLQSRGHLDEVLLKRWLRQLLEALQYIHSRHVVHRDLKATNVFLKSCWCSCLVGDFGISAVLDTSALAQTCVGTPAYMPPELFRNEMYSMAVDMWAVGVILYELMALTLPFNPTSLLTLVYQISFMDIDKGPLRSAGYSDIMVALVGRLLAKEPSHRPETGGLLDEEELWAGFSFEGSARAASEAYASAQQCKSDTCLTARSDGPGRRSKDCSWETWADMIPIKCGFDTQDSIMGTVEDGAFGKKRPLQELDCTLSSVDSITGCRRPSLPLNHGFDTMDSITRPDRPKQSQQASFTTQELRDAVCKELTLSQPDPRLGVRSSSRAGSRRGSRAGSAASGIQRAFSCGRLSRPNSAVAALTSDAQYTLPADNISRQTSMAKTLSMSSVLHEAISCPDVAVKPTLASPAASDIAQRGVGDLISGSTPGSIASADDILREELLRTRQSENPISPTRFEALLARLGGKQVAATLPSPSSQWGSVTSPNRDDEFTRSVARTGLFLKRRGVQSSSGGLLT